MALTAEKIEEFLDKLNDDEEFRVKLVKETASVLDEYGIDYDQADLDSLADLVLPDSGVVNDNRDAFRDALSANVAYFFDVTFEPPAAN